MKAKVLSAIKQNNMLSAGDHVTVGLSGGADSVALLCVLKELKDELEIKLSACHVNHNLRGEESDRDEAFCKELCSKLDIGFDSVSVDVKGYCQKHKLSTEEGARKLRYDALLDNCKDGKLATAHTLSDNAETVLINLARGTALDGLCGIPPIRGNIIRPLIGCAREEIESYLGSIGQSYVTDSSNLTDDYLRNRMRHHVIPRMNDFNPAFEETISRMGRALREDKTFLNDLAAEALQKAEIQPKPVLTRGFERLAAVRPQEKLYDRDALLGQKRPIRLRCLRMMLGEFDLSADSRRLNAMDAMLYCGEGCENLSGDTVFTCDGRVVSIVKRFSPLKINEAEFDLGRGEIPIIYPLSGRYYIKIRELTEKEIKLFVNNQSLQFKNAIDCDKIGNIVKLRNRQPGDKYKPLGRSFTQTFKNLFNAAALPASIRDSLAVLSDEQGVIWLEGFGVSQRAAVTSNTHRAFLVDISEE